MGCRRSGKSTARFESSAVSKATGSLLAWKAQSWSLLQTSMTTPVGFARSSAQTTGATLDHSGCLHAAWVLQHSRGYLGLQPQCVLRMAARHPPSSRRMTILALTSEGRLAPRFTRCAGAEPCDLICALPPVGYRRIWRGCVYSRPRSDSGTGASKDDSGIRLPLKSRPSSGRTSSMRWCLRVALQPMATPCYTCKTQKGRA